MRKCTRELKMITNILVVLIVVTILSGCAELQGVFTKKNTEKQSPKNTMRTAEVKTGDVEAIISGSGTFVPVKLISLVYNGLSGPLKRLYVKTNDEIKTGKLVAEFDQQNITKQVADQIMAVQISKFYNLQNIENTIMSGRNLKLAQIDLEQATKLHNEKPTYENSQELARQHIRYDQAVSADKNANWNKDISDIQSKLNESTLAELNRKLADTTLKSPVDGIVVFVENFSESQIFNSGHVIARIAETKNIVLQMLATDSLYIQNVKNGVLTIGSERYNVELYSPQPDDELNQASSDPKTNNRIYIKFSQKIPKITLQKIIYATLTIKKSNVIIVPKAALRDLDGKTVVDILKENLVDSVEVERGLEQDGNVEIISGLEVGQTVVLK